VSLGKLDQTLGATLPHSTTFYTLFILLVTRVPNNIPTSTHKYYDRERQTWPQAAQDWQAKYCEITPLLKVFISG
jgi:hypothetical protein